MARCHHSDWLTLRIERNEVVLCISDRLQTLINDTPSPDLQQSSLLVFIGHTAKSSALRSLGVDENRQKSAGRGKRGGGVHLQLGNPDVFQDVPVLLADGDLPYRGLKKRSSAQCHETRQLPLPRIRGGVQDLALEDAADHLYSRLLGAFADVFCFFSTDIGGFGPVVRRLASWLENGKPTTLPKTTYPRMVVVMEATDPGAERDKEAGEVLLGELREETTKNPLEMVSALEVVTVPQGGHCYRRLEEYLIRVLNQGRRLKVEARTLFSGRHLAAFFKYASDHFGRTTREPFDFVRASRLPNPVAPDLDTHLSNFLKHIKSPQELMDFAVPIIASSLLLDHYPPGMHDACYRVGRSGVLVYDGSINLLLPSGFVQAILEQLQKYFEDFIRGAGTPSKTIHYNNLKRFKLRWKRVRSDDLCFACLRRTPENNWPCGHAVCENCVRVFGQEDENDRWAFGVQRCFLCDMALREVTVKLKPDTAGVNVLTIDGGGIKGVVPLLFLQTLQDRLGLPIPVQDHFEIAFGTSSGGLIVLALFISGWTVDDCANLFESLAKRAFRPRWISHVPVMSRIPVLSHIVQFLVSYLADGLYPAHHLEGALKEVFGSEMGILDYSHATAIGAKVGIPVTTVLETDSCLFTNYNGTGPRPQDCGTLIPELAT
ncbi:hypothetical protein LTR96_010884 [Exophiala xenobiotica]|nr:hypothetical protein LTR92_010907 [Exophiala xenobiotica]KAK5215842.1 hypothetical protein LTR72_011143 [Exophiala xenobiotica]KAK5222342.1 hypothetical protein LTR47_010656 [Exophiala xenobiotica]KAK5246919.1 hypothetical protein LTS06_007838 [Exophiala xenobiotica]KAK5261281.1 hypothetical protein LTR40_002522 [Exophiala xenobiotica]